MKLEFQKCLSVMDRCLVLPHAVSRTKLHAALAADRKESEEQMVNTHSNYTSFTMLTCTIQYVLFFALILIMTQYTDQAVYMAHGNKYSTEIPTHVPYVVCENIRRTSRH